MSEQNLLLEVKKYAPFQVTGKGPVLDLLRELGHFVDKKTPLTVADAFRSDESGEIVCEVSVEGGQTITAALTNLKLSIHHPLYRRVKNYRGEVLEELTKQEMDVNKASFRVGDLYKKK